MPAETPTATTRISADDARKALVGLASEPGVSKPDPIVVADGVRRTFGGLTAVDVDHVEIQRGVITALIGPNGAGKTTFFNLLTGFDQPDQGDWSFNGTSLKGVGAFKVARMGMVRTFQLTKVLSKLSVLENMRLGSTGQLGERFWAGPLKFLWRGQEETNTERRARPAGPLQARQEGARLRRLAVRRPAQAARDGPGAHGQPELVMLDEPMAGVNPALKQSLLGHVKSLREEGMTVLFVEHDMDMVRDISDWVIVMAQGKVIAEGPPDSIMADQRVIDAYLGATTTPTSASSRRPWWPSTSTRPGDEPAVPPKEGSA
jgi:branched-chain amino acid transport system ATP-binding protein